MAVKKIDIIIPAYKAHDVLGRCLASIAMQVNVDQIQVTVVNDHCPMGSYKDIIECYQSMIDINELILPENSGPGVAKQFGIDNTECPYLMFLDADDTIVNAFVIKHMMGIAETEKSCEVYGNWYIEDEDGSLQVIDTKRTSVNGNIYKRDFLNKFDIRFNQARLHEDSYFERMVEYYLQFYNLPISHFSEEVMIYHYTPTSICKSIDDDIYSFTILTAWFHNTKELITLLEKRKAKLDILKINCFIEMFLDYNYIYRTQKKLLPDLLHLQREFYKEIYIKEPDLEEVMPQWEAISENKQFTLIDSEIRQLVPPAITFEDFLLLMQGE